MRCLILASIFIFSTVNFSYGQNPGALSLGFPADCRIGEDCWILSFFDNDPGDAYRDHRCSLRTYAGHDGTDIALTRHEDQVAVLAAAPGLVVGARNSARDNVVGTPVDFVAGQECGNGVRVEHGDGWTTQYCHLAKGSIAVGVGEQVERGQTLGMIGSSGASEVPHLHFSVIRDGEKIDPFLGIGTNQCLAGEPIWSDAAMASFGDYETIHVRLAGFMADDQPTIRKAQAAPAADRIPADGPAIILFTAAYGVPAGAEITLVIIGPDGAVLTESTTVTKLNRARQFRYAGKRTPAGGWPLGTYSGRVEVAFEGENFRRNVSVVVE